MLVVQILIEFFYFHLQYIFLFYTKKNIIKLYVLRYNMSKNIEIMFVGQPKLWTNLQGGSFD